MARSLEVAVSAGCISSGYCRNRLPDLFGTQEGRKETIVLTSPVPESEALWEAMEGCPVEAITATDAATGDVVFPDA